jgi:hypothetical protein
MCTTTARAKASGATIGWATAIGASAGWYTVYTR